MLSNLNKLNRDTSYLLRKTKSFNKSRYSRNRQYYRTGVFLCLWANILAVVGGYYVLYRLSFKFSYVFPIMLAAVSLFFFSFFSRNLFIGLIKALNSFISRFSLVVLKAYLRSSIALKVSYYL